MTFCMYEIVVSTLPQRPKEFWCRVASCVFRCFDFKKFKVLFVKYKAHAMSVINYMTSAWSPGSAVELILRAAALVAKVEAVTVWPLTTLNFARCLDGEEVAQSANLFNKLITYRWSLYDMTAAIVFHSVVDVDYLNIWWFASLTGKKSLMFCIKPTIFNATVTPMTLLPFKLQDFILSGTRTW